ncbi:YrhB domain-containing protein [Roseimicrobium sp. ORNL1]|uniref:YrhB domain-containing protein n=1 Tax=Roseimicrobium sp. ORNL1 TaxID=2711231 RepID=UPI0013E183FD|nr:YrhB domain-containing protein [Roseimicrobium sp. ORNL1]QIF03529.1 hypothetical protein G5S37_19030 [Roseimicrobium sp. ORNL1]
MLTFQEARILALAHLREMDRSARSTNESVIIDSATASFDFGWVFCYQNREYLETGRVGSAYAGNAPLLVDRHTGQLHETGTHSRLEYFVSNYQLTGDPHREPVWHLSFTLHAPSPDIPAAVRLFRDRMAISLAEAKRTVDALLTGESRSFGIGTREQAEEVRVCFAHVGFPSELVPK